MNFYLNSVSVRAYLLPVDEILQLEFTLISDLVQAGLVVHSLLHRAYFHLFDGLLVVSFRLGVQGVNCEMRISNITEI